MPRWSPQIRSSWERPLGWGDAAGRYIEFCKATFGEERSLRGVKLVIDCAHGATYHVAPLVFSELGAETDVIAASPDGYNINANVGSTATDALSERVRALQADVGIAFDGDGDRVIFVDHQGERIDGDQLLYILAMHRMAMGRADAGVVGTLMSNMGLELALAEQGIQLERANVGDRHVRELMRQQGWHLGGESSGHLICSDVTTTGDGIVSALQVLAAMIDAQASLQDLLTGMVKLPQVLINVPVDDGIDLNSAVITSVSNEVTRTLQGRGRLLLRPSGTEPVMRVMVEGEDPVEIQAHAQRLADVLVLAASLN